AQGAVITGKVTGRQGEALGGALVLIDELGAAVATTTAGTYTLTLTADKTKGQTVTLRARYIGFQPGVKQITLTPGTQTQDFQLKFDPMQLEAVVVTGVAEATERKKLTFAVGSVDASQLQQAPGVSALGSLEGKVAGARLINSSGAPGGQPTIRLRGATALTSPSACTVPPCAATEVPGPLIIVDGTITHFGLADINSEDTERVVCGRRLFGRHQLAAELKGRPHRRHSLQRVRPVRVRRAVGAAHARPILHELRLDRAAAGQHELQRVVPEHQRGRRSHPAQGLQPAELPRERGSGADAAARPVGRGVLRQVEQQSGRAGSRRAVLRGDVHRA